MKYQAGWIQFNTLCIFLFIGIIITPAMANYQSQEGRWMQQDPMEYVDGLNLYEYVKSIPILNRDSLGLSILTWGKDEPEWHAEKIWKRSQEIYNSDSPYDNMDEFLLMLDIAARTRLVIVLAEIGSDMPFIDLSDAIRLLKHYASNEGGTVQINYPKMIQESPSAMAHFESQIDDAISFVVNNKNIFKIGNNPFVSAFEEIPDAIEDSLNWEIAIHGYSTWDKGENVKCNCWRCEFDWTLNLRDIYDWNENIGARIFKIGVSPEELKLMHYWGVMQQFKVEGVCKTKVKLEWKRDENGRWIYEPIYEPCK